MRSNVIIVGGGYIGFELAKLLDPVANVTLIEPREAFTHAAAMIRAVVQPDLFEKALFPYDRLLQRGSVLRARAVAVEGDAVVLEDGTRLDADIIVVATGSGYAAPFKPAGDSIEAFRQAHRAAHEAVKAANAVAIVGAGAVGTELAGEIKAAMPGKSVTLISDLPSLMPDFPERLGQDLLRKLRLLGVEVIFNQKATDLRDTSGPFPGGVTLEDGREIAADVTFPAIGARPQNALLRALPGARVGADGRVRADRWMRPSELPNVLAAGDAVNLGDGMTIVATSRQVPWLAKAIRGMLRGQKIERTMAYAPWRHAPILLPLGERLGSSYLPPAGVQGNGPTRLIKGKSLFLPKYSKYFRTR